MKKTNYSLLIVLLISSVSICILTSCKKLIGKGPIITERRDVDNFREVKCDFSGDVYVKEGTEWEVRIEGQQNILDILKTDVNGDVLTVRFQNNALLANSNNVKVYITAPQVNGLFVSGSGNIYAEELNAALDVKVSGSGYVHIAKITCNDVSATVSGSGKIDIVDGNIDNEELRISGSGDIIMDNVQAATSSVNISGSGNAKVFVTDFLKVRISGSGDLYYRGSPQMDISISGSGKINPM